MRVYDVIVLGGGAAGLMCAATAGQRGKRVLVLEGSNKPGKKILMSGGGRCNFTNLYCDSSYFLSNNPHFCKSALARYTQWDFIALVEKHGIAYHEKTLGQLFCDESSKQIVKMLLDECREVGVELLVESEISKVEYNDAYRVTSAHGVFGAPSLVVATGGLSIPKMGASGLGYEIAQQFGLEVLETRAALVPFTFTGAVHEQFARLSGVSLPAAVRCGHTEFNEGILFTHRGMSGPAALQISSYWRPGESIEIDLLPGRSTAEMIGEARATSPAKPVSALLAQNLPKALISELDEHIWDGAASKRAAEMANATVESLDRQLHHWTLKPAATEGYRTAEVTLGGVNTDGISSRTMEAETQPGLFFIGEVVDVTGHLGGFNFQWAWASGVAAGNAV
ncbi:MAG: NAD(P)/FAD-dependent oxidoreductase [Pseudomonadota bacterium]